MSDSWFSKLDKVIHLAKKSNKNLPHNIDHNDWKQNAQTT